MERSESLQAAGAGRHHSKLGDRRRPNHCTLAAALHIERRKVHCVVHHHKLQVTGERSHRLLHCRIGGREVCEQIRHWNTTHITLLQHLITAYQVHTQTGKRVTIHSTTTQTYRKHRIRLRRKRRRRAEGRGTELHDHFRVCFHFVPKPRARVIT